jgi:hypothetical protein
LLLAAAIRLGKFTTMSHRAKPDLLPRCPLRA